MIIRGLIKKGVYFDSVSLMRVARELNDLDGVIDSSVVMGTSENKAILGAVGLNLPHFEGSTETDVLIGIKARNETAAESALQHVEQLFNDLLKKKDANKDAGAYDLEDALTRLPGANLSLISIAGRYAAGEAMKALKKGLHVMIFSDNVGIEEEAELKTYAHSQRLLMMGPDCGTAILNGIPLGFANAVIPGDIGIVAASGTGLQEVSSVISNNGGGISQAIGTGGRDIKEAIGGIMFLDALQALREDDNTRVIVLISKPPHPSVQLKIAAAIRNFSKPVICILLGGDPEIMKEAGAISVKNLEEAGLMAVAVSKGGNPEGIGSQLAARSFEIQRTADQLSLQCKGKYVRGLFSGGTLCDEAQLLLKHMIGDVYSNVPLNPEFKLADMWKSRKNSIIDLGEDEFTVGRPHPMIDYTLRNKRILEEASDHETAIILLDVVLGFGSHPDPASELVPVIMKARETRPEILFIASVTGTEKDPQNRKVIIQKLENARVIVMPSNVAAAELCGQIILRLSQIIQK
ncbi:MAG: acyl-CoA synthetase FdrA [Bacteroidetes bacterium]|nr:acyl-CoA synthetase FdrA [Bacteroidota bacterium]